MGLAILIPGCVSRPTASSDDGSDSAAEGTTTAFTSATNPSATDGGTPGVDTFLDTFDDSLDDDGVTTNGFICVVDDNEPWQCIPDVNFDPFECDLWTQDCPRGEKCMPWANDGGPAWNASRCSPVEPMPAAVGEPCFVEGSAVSGIDSCETGLMCWDVDPATNEGECVAMCSGDERTPVCGDPDTQCMLDNHGALLLCLPACDPLLVDCDPGSVCIPTIDESWVCVPGVTPPVEPGQPCEHDNGCGPGSVCAMPKVTPGCAGAIGCCAPVCDLTEPMCPDPATQCEPWSDPSGMPPQFVEQGICAATARPRAGWVDFAGTTVIAESLR